MKVLVTSKSFGKFNPEAVQLLERSGFTIVRGTKPSMTPAEIAAAIPGVDVLIVGNDTVDRAVFEAADRLKLVHMHGTGLDGIDLAAAAAKGVLVANAPGANKNAVAELAVALMLTVGRRIDKHSAALRQGKWERTPGREVSGSVVGLLGLGNIGKRIVELLVGFGPRLVVFDPGPIDESFVVANGIYLASTPDRVFEESDFLVLALPLTEQTRHIVNARTLGLMKSTAYVVNTSRGALIDDDALAQAINDKAIGGAALDAFASEPLPEDSVLRTLDIVITPHLAATSEQSTARVSQRVAENVIAIVKHGRTELAVNAPVQNPERVGA
jgi:phosphoglycerate dehydrogenase-like enzyme